LAEKQQLGREGYMDITPHTAAVPSYME